MDHLTLITKTYFMKRMIILPIMLFTVIAYGQLMPGIKAGVNISNFTGGDFNDIETNSLTSYHVGLYVRIPLGSFAIQPEMLFSEQGAKFKKPNEEEQEYKVKYINIPIMLQYHFSSLWLELGPQIGFKVDEDIPDPNIDDFAKSNDFAGAIGAGYQFKGFGIGARYVVGFSGVGDVDLPNVDEDFKNGVWQFSLLYTFRTGKKEKKEATTQ